ncbi:hypothetical protein F2Q69_00012563 [Brassica cretica]|uniref:Uncharacterized protein n=1 Tax=Brassica cretica TaxID=69181 RepID=A0A8S9R2F5_BRACR|nr:hypothetical protein F2Q69_00012563 [Brassica cretica]
MRSSLTVDPTRNSPAIDPDIYGIDPGSKREFKYQDRTAKGAAPRQWAVYLSDLCSSLCYIALEYMFEAIQGELVEIQSYIARRPEVSPSLDRRNNKSNDIHQQISVDKASNRGRLVEIITSDMSDTQNHGEEISADTYARLMRHQFNLESLGDR